MAEAISRLLELESTEDAMGYRAKHSWRNVQKELGRLDKKQVLGKLESLWVEEGPKPETVTAMRKALQGVETNALRRRRRRCGRPGIG